MNPTLLEIAGAVLFGTAVIHTFAASRFEHLAHTRRAHAGLWHLLGEVEAVFGFWAIVLVLFMVSTMGAGAASTYLDSRQFVEPMFVFVIMVVAASRPIMQLASDAVGIAVRALPVHAGMMTYFLGLSLVPLLGSFITEPAAMTLAALMLRERLFSRRISNSLKYATLGVLFVNVSIGGTLTNFAAPPVLMVAAKWDWSSAYLFSTIGWKALLAVAANALLATLVFRRQLRAHALATTPTKPRRVPAMLVALNVAILAAVVVTNHDPEMFMGLFLLFLGLADAYRHHHDKLMLREGLMVAFFLAGLVVLGGQQQWWLQAALAGLNASAVYFGAAALTAVTDNAALTYMGAQVENLSEAFKYALVTGAVTGGGLTVIANAPNPAGYAILKNDFDEQTINPLWLLLAALPPTATAMVCFRGPQEGLLDIVDADSWQQWFDSLDRSFIFLLMLPMIVAAAGIWSEIHRRDEARKVNRR